LNSRDGGSDTGIVGDAARFERHVEIYSHEDALTSQIQVAD
jgi:hypothetical protein